MNAGNM